MSVQLRRSVVQKSKFKYAARVSSDYKIHFAQPRFKFWWLNRRCTQDLDFCLRELAKKLEAPLPSRRICFCARGLLPVDLLLRPSAASQISPKSWVGVVFGILEHFMNNVKRLADNENVNFWQKPAGSLKIS
jgi:hypothetical protein